MFIVILIMIAGIAVGRLLRHRRLRYLGNVTNMLIWVLLFLLGVEVGSDERIVNGIATLGVEAVGVAIAGVAGSAALASGLWLWSKKRKEGGRDER